MTRQYDPPQALKTFMVSLPTFLLGIVGGRSVRIHCLAELFSFETLRDNRRGGLDRISDYALWAYGSSFFLGIYIAIVRVLLFRGLDMRNDQPAVFFWDSVGFWLCDRATLGAVVFPLRRWLGSDIQRREWTHLTGCVRKNQGGYRRQQCRMLFF